MSVYKVKSNLKYEGKLYEAGSEIEIKGSSTAEELIEDGLIEASVEAPVVEEVKPKAEIAKAKK